MEKVDSVFNCKGDLMDRTYLTTLFEYYGNLLTEKQREVVNFYYMEDFSMTEIAEITDTSKQAVSNLLKRSEDTLIRYENSLHMIKKSVYLRDQLSKLVDEMNNSNISIDIVDQVLKLIDEV